MSGENTATIQEKPTKVFRNSYRHVQKINLESMLINYEKRSLA